MSDVIELPSVKANRGRAAFLLATLVVASVIVGAVFDRYALQTPHRILGDTGFHPLSTMLRSPTDVERRQIRGELARELKLNARQDSAIAAIMTRNAGEFQKLRDEMRPRVESLVAQVRVQVDSVLTPQQREHFHKLQSRDAKSSAVSSIQQ